MNVTELHVQSPIKGLLEQVFYTSKSLKIYTNYLLLCIELYKYTKILVILSIQKYCYTKQK